MTLYDQSFSIETIKNIGKLPHPTVQKFFVITPVLIADFVKDLGKERGKGAFGSTGE